MVRPSNKLSCGRRAEADPSLSWDDGFAVLGKGTGLKIRRYNVVAIPPRVRSFAALRMKMLEGAGFG